MAATALTILRRLLRGFLVRAGCGAPRSGAVEGRGGTRSGGEVGSGMLICSLRRDKGGLEGIGSLGGSPHLASPQIDNVFQVTTHLDTGPVIDVSYAVVRVVFP